MWNWFKNLFKKKQMITKTASGLPNDDQPRVEIIGSVIDPKHGIQIELDWNDAFITYL